MRKRLATGCSSWQTRRVKRLNIVIIVAAVFAAIIAAFLGFRIRSTPPKAVLPTPNGYDDFAAAAQSLVTWSGDLIALPPEEIRAIVNQNSKALGEVHSGLKKPSVVPVTNDMTWFNTHMLQVVTHRAMAQLLIAEGLVHLNEGRTNEAARCFADCIVFAHGAHRHGLMLDDLVAIACQAMGARQLVQVAPHVSPEALREILPDLRALDQSREPAAAIVQRDREWSRGAYGVLRTTWQRIVMSTFDLEKSFENKHARSVTSLRLVTTELAVRIYQRERGKPPQALADLVPATLPAVPIDPFSQRPLLYRALTNSWLLYSVGSDGKDDGGTPMGRGAKSQGDLLPTTP